MGDSTLRTALRTVSAITILLCSTSSLMGQGGSPETLWIGVLRSDGGVVPIARYEEGGWSVPWPEPAYEGNEPTPPPTDVPLIWHVVGGSSQESQVLVKGVALAEAYCGRKWTQVTDQSRSLPKEESNPRRIVGMVASQPVDLVPGEQIPGIAEYRKRQGLVSNPVRGEGFRESNALGYFRLGARVIGVFYELGYEGELYEVHEVEEGGGGRVVRYHGGGC